MTEDQAVNNTSELIIITTIISTMIAGIFTGLFGWLNNKTKSQTDAKLIELKKEVEACAKDRDEIKETHKEYKRNTDEQLKQCQEGHTTTLSMLHKLYKLIIDSSGTHPVLKVELDKDLKDIDDRQENKQETKNA